MLLCVTCVGCIICVVCDMINDPSIETSVVVLTDRKKLKINPLWLAYCIIPVFFLVFFCDVLADVTILAVSCIII